MLKFFKAIEIGEKETTKGKKKGGSRKMTKQKKNCLYMDNKHE